MPNCLEHLKYYLNEAGVHYEVSPHRTAYTAQTVAAEAHEPGWHVAKVVMAKAEGRPVMLVLSAPAHVDIAALKRGLGWEYAALAREDEFRHLFPDCDLGAMPPFGNLYGVPVYLDEQLANEAAIVFQPGSHRTTMKIAMADYLRLVAPTLAGFALEQRRATP
jgi:Ala-tRNA(Pro) deacylase